MKKTGLVLTVLVLSASFVMPCTAQENFAMQILRSGLLGAGAGAVGGAASGAKGRDIWKGALAGAGMNIVGGALLDSITGQTTTTWSQKQYKPQERNYYVQPQRQAIYTQPTTYSAQRSVTYDDLYRAIYNKAYKEGYTQGFKDGMREALQ